MKLKTGILGAIIGANSLLIGCKQKPVQNNVIKYTPKLEQTINKSLDSLNSKDINLLGGQLTRTKHLDKKDKLLQQKIEIIDLKYQELIQNLKLEIDSLKAIINKSKN